MHCEEFETRCHELLDSRRPLDSDPHLTAHALHCSSCAQDLQSLQQLLLGIEVGAPAPPADFARVVVRLAAAQPARPARRGWGVRVSWLAAAAAAALLISASWRPDPPAPLRNGPLAAENEREDGWPEDNWPEDGWQVDQRGLRSMIAALTARMPPEETMDRAMQGFEDVARPIASPFGAAFSALRRSIPPMSPANGGKADRAFDKSAATLRIAHVV